MKIPSLKWILRFLSSNYLCLYNFKLSFFFFFKQKFLFTDYLCDHIFGKGRTKESVFQKKKDFGNTNWCQLPFIRLKYHLFARIISDLVDASFQIQVVCFIQFEAQNGFFSKFLHDIGVSKSFYGTQL